jgi:FKBP12-rapamycin complex-associated protein
MPEDTSTDGFTEDAGNVSHTTLRDISFRQSYGRQLSVANGWLRRYESSRKLLDLHQAWEIYQIVFKKIKTQISTLKSIEMHHVSPALTNAVNLSLAIPGTYKPNKPTVSIAGFSASVDVIASKQRPRKMHMTGSDGVEYKFLLKGHEDLRQDERVMQLFGLINACFDNVKTNSNRGLRIVRYSVLPLSNNSGVIGWVENCDTINQLVKTYREMKNIRLNTEMRLLNQEAPNYLQLPLVNKVEAFTYVLDSTSGQDLARMLWLKSKTSDTWVERRTNFTKSMAIMSMVGYILGLGDRHPSNLMVDRVSGRVVHIDFGDCFEVTAKRAAFPEKIPFRLTRMITTAMERSGTEGPFRLNCERVMFLLVISSSSSITLHDVY